MYTCIHISVQPAWDPVFKDLVLKKMVCWATYGNIRPVGLFFKQFYQSCIFAGRGFLLC